ncbi:acetyl-CoA acetyltransferase [Parasphingopyxis lamellibrachiae]|uniref:Acetyl-CoA C-acetyltransferase n=1 Tax=Parasphingopyxis lamellibrachiae TaxID=680125 RepID=A0A3D9FFA9_9SPHN|nr:acetyl-CoA acetyltransferase [Parasphingopyxis lamellibrachiae]RED16328.1 acetyl-CoA C-acetyltransferase [Parasphingopyxis lamellibrachiae]
MAEGIRDKVAIVGMGCSQFGERWDCSAEDLMVESFGEALADANIERDRIEAAWFGLSSDDQGPGKSALSLSSTLRLPNIAATRVENMCATGTEALRGAVYGVASGAYDIALALGVEKLKDTGYGGLPERTKGTFEDLWFPSVTAPGSFAQFASAYVASHGIDMDQLKEAMAHVSWKSHENGALNPKAHLRKRVTKEKILGAPMIAYPLGLFDCCGVSDGSACAIVTTPAIAEKLGGSGPLVTVKSMQLALSNGSEIGHDSWDGSYAMTTRIASERAYREAGIRDPRAELDLIEVHDCFSITELVTMEDLGLSDIGRGWQDVLAGKYDSDGEIPCNIDGGLKCFGHPIGATGLRMVYELYQQLRGSAGDRQLDAPTLGLTHNLGGFPNKNVCSISVIGTC